MKPAEVDIDISQSGLVVSGQDGIHPRLEKFVRRHLETQWTQPLHHPTIKVYQRLQEQGVLSVDQPFILDSGCGTGKSTQQLAGRFPRTTVIGIDRSPVRLAKSGVDADWICHENYVLLRAEMSTFWRLLLADDHRPERHYLLYPNPWPKPAHLQRRWHGHPVFPQFLLLGGEIEMRCNWEIYALEFARAVSIATGHAIRAIRIHPEKGISPFEQKYLERGQRLFAVHVPAQVITAYRQACMASI